MDVDDEISKLSNSFSSFNSLTSFNSIHSNESTNLSTNLLNRSTNLLNRSTNLLNRSTNRSTNLLNRSTNLSIRSMNLSTNLNDDIYLDDDCLLLIFERLNIKELSNCSLVCKKFYNLTKKLINLKRKHIQLHFAIGPYCYFNNYNLIKYLNASIDQFYSPILIDDYSIFNHHQLFEPLVSLVLITNQLEFSNKSIFNFILQLPNLKYLETNDRNFCSNLNNLSRFLNKYQSLSIEHLILFYCDLNTIIRLFPNLLTLNLDYLENSNNLNMKSIDYELKWTFLSIKEERINDRLIDFLCKNCKQLKYLEVNLAEFGKINQLERLLKELNWINEYYLFIFGATFEIKDLLSKYIYRFLNFNFKLTINFVRIESNLNNLEPIYSANETKQFKYFEIKQLENDCRSNLNRLEYYNKIKKLTIDSNKQNLKYQNCSYQLKLNTLIIDDDCFNDKLNNNRSANLELDLDFNLLINNTLPKTINVINFKFNRNIAQYILNRLPIVLPYLIKVSFINLGLNGDRSYDFKFLSNLIYLNEIKFINIKFKNEQQLINVVDNCKFLFKLNISYDRKLIDQYLEDKFQLFKDNLKLRLKKKKSIF